MYSRRARGTSAGYSGNAFPPGTESPSHILPDRDLQENLSSRPLQTLQKPDSPLASHDMTAKAIKPENVKYIGSYNWVEEITPTIIVPGSPPIWQERHLPLSVRPDRGVRMVDQNSFRMGGASCLLPLFRAADVIAEENADTSLDWSTVDIVTDRNGLRKLMRWLRHSDATSGGQPLKEFRIDLQLGGSKTVLMHRWEQRYREIAIPPTSGYGINFERETTSPAPGCQCSAGHHRIVQYDLDGLNMIVRFEVDACTAALDPLGSTSQRTKTSRVSHETSVDELADALTGLGVSSSESRNASSDGPPSITVITAGSQVAQSSVVELVTRSERNVDQFDWNEQYPQLLLSDTPHLFLGVHNRGTFQRIKKHALGSSELQQVETDAALQKTFRQLVAILRSIQQIVKTHGDRGRLSLVCEGGVLQVYERIDNSDSGRLSDSDLARFRS
ncbi:hypothetical protein GY45DRAFT_1280600 [Cubamyces sp. BRFM 1775]|nr:hypothetical protein GY45DRAFT_1280600 [Cubamyces sp. BRFM 1775]